MRNTFICFTLLLSIGAFAQLQYSPIKLGRTSTIGLPFDPSLKPFYHGIASGDPLETSVIIWTRVTPEVDQPLNVTYYMATDTSFTNIIKTGMIETNIDKDYTVKIDVTGLTAGMTYYYYFNALGANSIVGKTKTTAASNTNNLKFAVVSCANYEGGYFNAFGRISKRTDLDAVIHLGDYIYEYAPGQYKNSALTDPNRSVLPAVETVTEADYRTRYSLYRLDSNLRMAHQQHPFISIWDDHESANDSYVDGAENHDDSTQGNWNTRKNIAKKVYYEWMPIRDNNEGKLYRSISYGNLVELIMLDTRLEGREKPPVHFDTPDVPARKIISQTQFDWFVNKLKNSNAKWKVVGNQLLFSTFNVGFAATNTSGLPDPTGISSIRTVEDGFIDNWESYPTQRNSIIDTIRNNNIQNVVIVSGDSHCSWAFDVTKNAVLYPLALAGNIPQPNPYNPTTKEGYTDGTAEGSWAVEFGTPSIASQNFDEAGFNAAQIGGFEFGLNNPIATLGNANYNPHLAYNNLSKHGYFVLDLKEDSAQTDFFYVPNVVSVNTTESLGQSISVLNNTSKIGKLNLAGAPEKPVKDIPAPNSPRRITGITESVNSGVIFTLYPNPAHDYILLNFASSTKGDIEININDIQGKLVKTLAKANNQDIGLYQMEYEISDLKEGTYILTIHTGNEKITRKLIKK